MKSALYSNHALTGFAPEILLVWFLIHELLLRKYLCLYFPWSIPYIHQYLSLHIVR